MQLGTGTLSRVVRAGVHASNMRIAISPPTESEIHLLIDDGSNPPLEIIRVSALMAELPVIFFESGGGAMIARYGNRTMQAPAYDLEALRTSIDPAKLPDVAWGDVHRFRFHGIDLPGDGAPGTYGVYRVLNFDPQPDGRRVAGRISAERPLVGNGDAWILMVHFARPIQAWSVLAYGQTTRAGSPHVSDQIRLFADHRLRQAFFTDAEIAAHTEREYRPQ